MTRDQETVEKLQRRFRHWHSNEPCKIHPRYGNEKCYKFDEFGRLIELDLCKLGLTEVPSEIWQCTALQTLRLYDNKINRLSPDIGKLTALQTLNLFNNRLDELPAEIGNLFMLKALKVDNNPLQSLLRSCSDFLELPTEEQLIFLRTRQLQEGMQECFEAKVILVGEPDTGKTSLLQYLRGQPFALNSPATYGIEVGTLDVPHPAPSEQKITLYTWDFGGQETFQATHQFFFTTSSVYLLVWNARRGEKACRLPFWLDTIVGHAPAAKIILVATHTDEWAVPSIDYVSYQKRYPQIFKYSEISNSERTDEQQKQKLEALKVQIADAAAQTPFVGRKWPRTWLNATQHLLAHPGHHIDETTFRNICIQQGIKEPTDWNQLGDDLHELGKILYFRTDPILKTLIVLKPNWISKAISLVLTDSHIQHMGGIVEYKELESIWTTDEQGHPYPDALYPVFVRMMERFDLCYQLEPDQSTSQILIPQLLSHQPPGSLSAVPTKSENGQMLVEMRYRLSFVPEGLISWFLVRTHHYSQHQHWREGARLAYDYQQAQIELDREQREISIRVWGTFPYNFLQILKKTLDVLLQRFTDIRIQRMIPCCCEMQHQNPHYHVYERLEERLSAGETAIICPEQISISLTTLLYGIHPSTFTLIEAKMHQSNVQRQLSNQQVAQMMELFYRRWLNLERSKVDNGCPSLFILEPISKGSYKNVYSRRYHLHLLCQHPSGPHLVKDEQGYEIPQGREWWNKMSPWIRHLVKMLEIWTPIGETLNEGFKLVDIARFQPAIDLFKEGLDNLDTSKIVAIDTLNNTQLDSKKVHTRQQAEGVALEALKSLLKNYAPPWQGLSQFFTDDGTVLWLCEAHRKNFDIHIVEAETPK